MDKARIQQAKFITEDNAIKFQERINEFLKTKDSDEVISVKYNTEITESKTLYTAMIVYTQLVEIKE